MFRKFHFRCLHGLLDESQLVQLQHSVRKFALICIDWDTKLTSSVDFPWLERDDLELALTFQLKALCYLYNAKLNKSAGKYLGHSYLSQFGEFAVTGPATDAGAASHDCNIVDVLITRPPTGEDCIQEDQGALGDFCCRLHRPTEESLSWDLSYPYARKEVSISSTTRESSH